MIAISLISFSPNNVAETPIPPQPLTVQELVTKYSNEYGVSRAQMIDIMTCENHDFDTDLQSYITYKKGNHWGLPAGSREQSYGLVMIHLPDHPEITYEQAIDPEFAVEYLAKKLSEGKGEMWSCY